MNQYLFKFYLSGDTPGNKILVENLKKILDDTLKEQYTLETIYVTNDPQIGKSMNIFSTPTLIKQSPPPARFVVGNLTDKERLLMAVNLLLS